MTYYYGGKKKIGKDIASVINQFLKTSNQIFQGYCEPFCGMLGVYKHIIPLFDHDPQFKFLAGDRNDELIILWKALQNGWNPPKNCTKEQYQRLKKSPRKSPKKSFIGHACSWGGIYFGSYVDRKNYISPQLKNINNMKNIIERIDFKDGEFDQYSKLKKFIIYCDPPYQGARNNYRKGTLYSTSFNHDKFYEWCRKMAKNNLVFVSGFKAPEDFEEIWSKEKERLFIIH